MKLSIILVLGLSQLSAAIADFAYFSVNWPLESGRVWKDTTTDIQEKTGITRYALFEQSKPRIYRYTLEVDIKRGWAKTFRGTQYRFTDSAQPPDTYDLTAHISRIHKVDFDSDNPHIQAVGIEM